MESKILTIYKIEMDIDNRPVVAKGEGFGEEIG